MTPAEFKSAFPAFVNEPNADVQRHINASVPFLNVARWGAKYPAGVGLWVAHSITVEKQDRAAAATGAPVMAMMATHKQVGSVSVSYSAEAIKRLGQNYYLRTTYGERFWQMARMVGFGVIAV